MTDHKQDDTRETVVKIQRDALWRFIELPVWWDFPTDDILLEKTGDRLIITPAAGAENGNDNDAEETTS